MLVYPLFNLAGTGIPSRICVIIDMITAYYELTRANGKVMRGD
jgi:hypothetical protein